MARRNVIKYHLVDPDGNHHKGENLRQFAREHNLDQACIFRVHSGEKPQYKGWTSGDPDCGFTMADLSRVWPAR